MKKFYLTVAMAVAMLSGHAQEARYADFAFDFFDKVSAQTPDNNVIVSPLSAQLALSMLQNGAQGETLKEIMHALHLDGMTVGEVNDYNKALMTKMCDNSLPENIKKEMQKNGLTVDEKCLPAVEFAGGVWSSGVLKDAFVNTNAQYYEAQAQTVDFTKPETWDAIDAWAAEKTHGNIKTLGLEHDSNTSLVLANALYFKGAWSQKCFFAKEDTKDMPFYNAKGDAVNVPMMFTSNNAVVNDKGVAVRLSYGYDDKFSMTLFLPKDDATYTNNVWSAIRNSKETTPAKVRLPKFELDGDYELTSLLKDMGIKQAFGSAADFSLMSTVSQFVSQAKQRSHIAIDEEGTEAAAVTVILSDMTAGGDDKPIKYIDVTFDHPFYFSIEDNTSGTVLFLGKVNNLTGTQVSNPTAITTPTVPATRATYTLEGRKADGNSKGIVIKDGKKMIR